jgi:hypothetical protein
VPRLDTSRLNIRYFNSINQDAVEGTVPSVADSKAASVPYIFGAISRRRLLHSDVDYMQAGLSWTTRAGRSLLQSNTTSDAFLWMDLNGDSLVDIKDSLLFADVIKLVDADESLHCKWLQSLYHPSSATTPYQLVRGNAFTDTSIVSNTSIEWQAVDPKLIYLRSNASEVMYNGHVCSSLPGTLLDADETVPALQRFDGTSVLTQADFQALVPASSTADPAGLFKAFMRPDEARDWRMYTVRMLSTPPTLHTLHRVWAYMTG